ncbi:MAG: hypothetical protein ACRDLQ_10025 [Solirubrobacterales bacterium]
MVLSLLGAAVAQAAFPGLNGQIATGVGDIRTVFPDGTGVRTIIPNARDPAWSPDGLKLAWAAPSNLGTSTLYAGNADGSGAVQLTSEFGATREPAWSPDGTMVAFSRGGDIWTVGVYGTGETNLTTTTNLNETSPAWSPDGTKIAFTRISTPPPATSNFDIYVMNADGTGVTQLTTNPDADRAPNWSPDGTKIAFASEGALGGGIFRISPDGSGRTLMISDVRAMWPAWSPDGTKIAYFTNYTAGGETHVSDLDGSNDIVVTAGANPDWQPLLFPGYARPRSASPLRVSLVPTYNLCFSPNRTHGPPLAFGSCNPPSQQSNTLIVGSPDANGEVANSVASARLATIPGDVTTLPDEADVAVEMSATDIRCRAANAACPGGALSDYAGTLLLTASLRVSDKFGGPSGNEPVTVQDDASLRVPVPCTATPDPDTGATCSLATTADAVTPGLVQELGRTMWQLGAVDVYDAGPNGTGYANCPPTCGNGDEAVFLRQGLFIP